MIILTQVFGYGLYNQTCTLFFSFGRRLSIMRVLHGLSLYRRRVSCLSKIKKTYETDFARRSFECSKSSRRRVLRAPEPNVRT